MGGFFVLSDVTMDNSRGKFMPPCCFHQVEVHHFNRPKISNNSLIRDQKSNKHIANGYKKLVHTFKREAVQLFVAKKPCRKSLTAGSPSCGLHVNCKLQT